MGYYTMVYSAAVGAGALVGAIRYLWIIRDLKKYLWSFKVLWRYKS
jgi:hypothetical protein